MIAFDDLEFFMNGYKPVAMEHDEYTDEYIAQYISTVEPYSEEIVEYMKTVDEQGRYKDVCFGILKKMVKMSKDVVESRNSRAVLFHNTYRFILFFGRKLLKRYPVLRKTIVSKIRELYTSAPEYLNSLFVNVFINKTVCHKKYDIFNSSYIDRDTCRRVLNFDE